MTTKKASARHELSRLHIDFDAPVEMSIDISRVEMTPEQRTAVEKLLAANPSCSPDSDSTGDSPARAHLSTEEFELIKDLKATLGASVPLKGLICDFALKCVALQ